MLTTLRPSVFSAFAMLTLLLSVGCRSYRFDAVMEPYRNGQLEIALEEITDPGWCRGHRDQDELIWQIERGKLLFDMGRYEECSTDLAAAMERFRYLEEETSRISIGDEMSAVLTGLPSMTYRSDYTVAMHMNSVLALSDLARGRSDQAYTAIVNATNWYKEIELQRAEQIARSEELATSEGLNYSDVTSIRNSNPELQGDTLRDRFAGGPYSSPKHDYLNPFALFVSGLVKTIENDANAEVDFRLASEIVPNPFLSALSEKTLAADDGTVFLIYERGLAPERVEEAIAFPTPHYGVNRVALPTLRFAREVMGSIWCQDSNGQQISRTEPLASFERIVSTQFDHDFPGILLRTLIAAGAREAVDQVAAATIEDQRIRLAARIITNLWKLAASAADLRTVRLVGAELQLAAFKRPEDGVVDLTWTDAAGRPIRTDRIEIDAAPTTVLFTRSVGTRTLIVSELWGSNVPSAQTPVELSGP